MKYKNVKVGVNTLNDMLGRRGLPLLSVEDYKEKFGFPVIDFYDRVGFDMEKESFHELSVDFVETYDKYAGEVGLNEGVREVLAGIQQTGVKQYVLSALREDLLQQMLRHFQIDSRFDRACGANDIYAAGKIERGQQMLQTCPIVPEDTLMEILFTMPRWPTLWGSIVSYLQEGITMKNACRKKLLSFIG